MRFYLAHPILKRKEIRKKEIQFEQDTGIELVNPFYDAVERKDIEEIDKGKMKPYSSRLECDSLVEGDLKTIDGCDGIIAYIEKDIPSVGTFMELWYGYTNKKRIFIITTTWNSHPWIRYVVKHTDGEIVKSFQELKLAILVKTSVRLR